VSELEKHDVPGGQGEALSIDSLSAEVAYAALETSKDSATELKVPAYKLKTIIYPSAQRSTRCIGKASLVVAKCSCKTQPEQDMKGQ
jgi:hypothetical protein